MSSKDIRSPTPAVIPSKSSTLPSLPSREGRKPIESTDETPTEREVSTDDALSIQNETPREIETPQLPVKPSRHVSRPPPLPSAPKPRLSPTSPTTVSPPPLPPRRSSLPPAPDDDLMLHRPTRHVPSPFVSTKPVEPIKPTESVEHTAPIEPIEPIGPIEPIEPIGPIEPIEPIGPIEPIEPIGPIEPIEPIEPSPDNPPSRHAPLLMSNSMGVYLNPADVTVNGLRCTVRGVSSEMDVVAVNEAQLPTEGELEREKTFLSRLNHPGIVRVSL